MFEGRKNDENNNINDDMNRTVLYIYQSRLNFKPYSPHVLLTNEVGTSNIKYLVVVVRCVCRALRDIW